MKSKFRLPPKTDQPSVSFFVPGIPTGHGRMKWLDPDIGKKFIDGLHTLAKAAPEQRWKHAIVEAAQSYARMSGPLFVGLVFVIHKGPGERPLITYMAAMLDTLEGVGLINMGDIAVFEAKKELVFKGMAEGPGCFVRIHRVLI